MRAVGSDQPVALQLIRTFRCLQAQQDRAVAIGGLRDIHELGLPADVDTKFRASVDQVLFGVVLLQVDEGRHLLRFVGFHAELIEQFIAIEHLAQFPAHALVRDGVGRAHAVPDLQRALGIGNGARTVTDRVVIVDQDHRHAAHLQVDGGAQAHGSRADHDDRMAREVAVTQFGWAFEWVDGSLMHEISLGERCCSWRFFRSRRTPEASSFKSPIIGDWRCFHEIGSVAVHWSMPEDPRQTRIFGHLCCAECAPIGVVQAPPADTTSPSTTLTAPVRIKSPSRYSVSCRLLR